MAESAPDPAARAAEIIARITLADAAAEMASEFASQISAFAHLSAESQAEIVDGLQRSTKRWSIFLSSGVMPADAEFDPLRAWARARATEGVRLEDLLRSFGLAHQVGWRLLRRHAGSDEEGALLALVAPLAEYVDEVSAVVTETYLAERELLVSEDERQTQRLLDRLSLDVPLDAAESELAERLGVPIEALYTPFAIAKAGHRPHNQGALAARLRAGGWKLAVTDGDYVVGLAWTALELHDLGEGRDVVLAVGEPTRRGELAAAREEIVLLADYARRVGLLGRVAAAEHLLEILLSRSPELTARLRERVLAPLVLAGQAELVHTLRALVDSRLDRTATSGMLHVHRNTLAYRLKRIEEITGLDLASPRDLACVHIALEVDTDLPEAAPQGSPA